MQTEPKKMDCEQSKLKLEKEKESDIKKTSSLSINIGAIVFIGFIAFVVYDTVFGTTLLPGEGEWRLLERSVKNGDIQTAQTAIQNGANINYQPHYSYEPAWWESLFTRSHRHGLHGEDKTPLMVAISGHNYPMTIMLLENGANPCVKNDTGETPLSLLQKQINAPQTLIASVANCKTYSYRPGYGIN